MKPSGPIASLCSGCRRSIFASWPRRAFSTSTHVLQYASTETRAPPRPPRGPPPNTKRWNTQPRFQNPKLAGAVFEDPHVAPPVIKEGEGVTYFEEHVKEWTGDPKTKQLLLDFGIPEKDLDKLLKAYADAVSSKELSKEPELYQLGRFSEQHYHRFNISVLYSNIFFTWAIHPSHRTFLLDSLDIAPSTLAHMEKLGEATDRRYMAEGYAVARQLHRKVIIHVGPTNSGKTHHALRALAAAPTGVYAGPLRLLAHEIWERLNLGQIAPTGSEDPSFAGTDITDHIDTLAHGPAIKKFGNPMYARLCNMKTGEEQKYVSVDAPLLSCTVEMLPYSYVYDVAVVDEIQMIADPQRGGGWTEAVVGLPARELHLCGEETAVPIVENLLKDTGDEVIVKRYERLTPLKVEEKSLEGSWANVQKGDCVVAFSRTAIFAIKRKIEVETGLRCAVIYGRLPPEIRSEQAALFNDPNSGYDVLVGSDAIGMGLNLKIRRLVFDAASKTRRGGGIEPLSVSQVKQIAGRAGRFGMQTSGTDAPGGFVTCLNEKDMAYISECLATPFTSLDFARIRFDTDSFTQISRALPSGATTATIVQAHHHVSPLPPKIRYHDHDLSNLPVYDFVDEFGGNLNVAEKVMHISAPVSWRDPTTVDAMKRFMKDASTRPYVDIEACLKPTPFYDALLTVERAKEAGHALRNAGLLLSNMEGFHKAVVLYIWMSFRMPVLYSQYGTAGELKERLERALQWVLEKVSEGANAQHNLNQMDGRAGARHPLARTLKERVQRGAAWAKVMEEGKGPRAGATGSDMGRAEQGSRPHIPSTTKLGARVVALGSLTKVKPSHRP